MNHARKMPRTDYAELTPELAGLSSPSTRKVLEWALVLEALSIPWELSDSSETSGFRRIRVPAECLTAARRQVEIYEKENRDWPPREIPPPPNIQPSAWSAVWVGGLIGALYFWLGPYDAESEILRRAACDSRRVLQGQWWRIFTAIGVHGDIVHLFSNLCVIVPVGAAAAMLLGGGATWTLALLSGALANLTYLVLFDNPPTSFGASTAAFALLGLLGGRQAADASDTTSKTGLAREKNGGKKPGAILSKRTLLILGATLAIFAMLGSAPHSNLAGHFFGLLYGLLLGAGSHYINKIAPAPQWLQRCLELFALAVFMFAWRMAAM